MSGFLEGLAEIGMVEILKMVVVLAAVVLCVVAAGALS